MFLLFTRPSRPFRPAPLRQSPRALQPGEADDGITSCGWFDSSHDLRLGLLATELPHDAPLPSALELELCLAA